MSENQALIWLSDDGCLSNVQLSESLNEWTSHPLLQTHTDIHTHSHLSVDISLSHCDGCPSACRFSIIIWCTNKGRSAIGRNLPPEEICAGAYFRSSASLNSFLIIIGKLKPFGNTRIERNFSSNAKRDFERYWRHPFHSNFLGEIVHRCIVVSRCALHFLPRWEFPSQLDSKSNVLASALPAPLH